MFKFFAIRLLLLTMVFGCASTNQPIGYHDLFPGTEQVIRSPSPSLWKVTGRNGNILHILGSIHALPPGSKWQTPLLNEVIENTDQLVLERVPITSPDQALRVLKYIKKNGYTEDTGNSLLAQLPKELHSQARQLWFSVMPDMDGNSQIDAIKNVRPWYYFLISSSSPDIPIKNLQVSKRLVVDTDYGVEAYLKQKFNPTNTKAITDDVAALRTLFEIGDEVALQLIIHRLSTIAETRSELIQTLHPEVKIREAWIKGDDDQFWTTYQQREANTPKAQHEFLINRRNTLWLAQIIQHIESDQKTLVVVGSAHLFGEMGLLNQLKLRGYHPVKIQGRTNED
ncbi:TraB/GumN family protein [Kordiimonas sp. SCSIO 12610]|uniref:TraB/GumN family protein n=1 Tax=Kordiimonas sp. SCSIO 12610 TaxID=2829597 RepID=UPI00210E329E|nr:TraB/GumN family protein [Kordiimonas sp. SCSIO 12610]UTW55682.1 TraB/GumN family protein [Kordiimonas sp. SCSIO 12610]